MKTVTGDEWEADEDGIAITMDMEDAEHMKSVNDEGVLRVCLSTEDISLMAKTLDMRRDPNLENDV